MSVFLTARFKKTKGWGEDRHPLVTVTCPHNCGWKVRLHKQHVSFNLAGHLEDCHDGR